MFRSDAARAVPRRPGRAPAARPHGHPRRAAHRAHRGWQPPRARTCERHRPGALPPARGAGLGRRPTQLLERAGVDVERLDSGCCGLAGNFGFTAGHGDVSRGLRRADRCCPASAQADRRHRRARRRVLLPHPDPRPRQRRTAVHLAELLADVLARPLRADACRQHAPAAPVPPATTHPRTARHGGDTMSTTVADHLLDDCASGGSSRSSATPATASTASSAPSRAPTTSRGSSRRGTRRWPRSRPSGYAKFGGRAGRLHGDLGTRRDPPAQRPVRRQARPRPGGRDRRPDQPHRDGRQLPAGGRPAQPVQGRRQRLRADGHRPRAAAQRARPRHPDRHEPARADRDHHPERRAGAGVRRRPTHAFKMVPSSLGIELAAPSTPTTTALRRAAEILNAGEKVALLVGQGARGAAAEVERGRRPARRRRRQGAARQGRALRRAAVRDRLDRPARAPGPATR